MNNDEPQSPEDVEVRLGPVLGVGPQTYVPLVYGLLILLILLFVLVVPGIRHHGSLVTVITAPRDASLYVDGVRVGSSPGEFFVRSGARTIEARRPGFATRTQTVEVRGRLIGSWIWPRRDTIRVVLEGADPDSLARAAAIEFSGWSLTGEASGQYQFPPVARALASDLRAAARTASGTEAHDSWVAFYSSALPQVTSEAALNDLAAGALSLGGETAVAVPAGIAAALQQFAVSTAAAELLPLQIAAALSSERLSRFDDTPAVSRASAEAQALAALRLGDLPGSAGSSSAYALGLEFVELGGGVYVLGGESRASRGGDIPYRVALDPYLVSLTEVPFAVYDEFVRQEPSWSVDNRATLVEQDLVDVDYLADLERMRADPRLPVTGVSAYAAEAFARWYSDLLPSGLVARLPTEAEWAHALLVSGSTTGVFAGRSTEGPVRVEEAGTGEAGIAGMLGNVWEWTSDSFAPYAFVHGGTAALPAVHRVVRGGGWATESVGFRAGDRGSMHPSWTSPFVGFRLVISPVGI